MAKTIVGLFDESAEAGAAVREIVQYGIAREHVSLMTNHGEASTFARSPTDIAADDGSGVLAGASIGAIIGGVGGLLVGLAVLPIPGLGPVIAAGPLATTLAGLGLGAATGGLVGALTDIGVPEEHAHHYAEGVRRGGTLVTVNADDAMAPRVAEIMNRHRAVDVNQRASMWRESGWTGYNADAKALTSAEIARDREAYRDLDLGKGKVTIPVVEEKVAVGKREVESGAVRVFNRVVEEPVDERVTLRDERVNIERRAVNRPATASDAAAFREGTLEFKETVEEPVVSKTARVIEEVVINKNVRERTENVHDTVKRTEVDVQKTSDRSSQTSPPRSTR